MSTPINQTVGEPTSNITIHLLSTKGNALLTTRFIARGSLIVAEAPLLRFHNSPTLTSGERYRALALSIAALSPANKTTFYSLFNAQPSPPGLSDLGKAVGILQTNNLPLSENVNSTFSSSSGQDLAETDMTMLGVFTTISRANHSCIPNAEFSWCEAKGEGRLFAVCAIEEGEEVVIDYAGGQPFADRAGFLSENFGFECACGVCVEGGKGNLLEEFERLEQEIVGLEGAPESMTLIQNALGSLDEIGIMDMRMARMYKFALQTATHQDDRETSQLFAQLYLATCIACLGDDHVESRHAKETFDDLLGD